MPELDKSFEPKCTDAYGTPAIKALIPCTLQVVNTKTFKDGTSQYLVFGTFDCASSKEQPTYMVIRASSEDEAVNQIRTKLIEELQAYINGDDFS